MHVSARLAGCPQHAREPVRNGCVLPSRASGLVQHCATRPRLDRRLEVSRRRRTASCSAAKLAADVPAAAEQQQEATVGDQSPTEGIDAVERVSTDSGSRRCSNQFAAFMIRCRWHYCHQHNAAQQHRPMNACEHSTATCRAFCQGFCRLFNLKLAKLDTALARGASLAAESEFPTVRRRSEIQWLCPQPASV